VFFQDKDGRETPLAEAGSQQEIRLRDNLGSRCCAFFVGHGQLLEVLLLLLLLLLFLAALSDPPVAKADQVGRILFDAVGNPPRELFQGLGIVPVGRAKVMDAHWRVLGQLERRLLIIAAIALHLRSRKVHGWCVCFGLLCFVLLCFADSIVGVTVACLLASGCVSFWIEN
jgi:hypothetical protein